MKNRNNDTKWERKSDDPVALLILGLAAAVILIIVAILVLISIPFDYFWRKKSKALAASRL
jgi:hypothetical protein